MHYVIIGAGPSGVSAAETLRAEDPDCLITLIGGEDEPPYSRMAIPYFLIGKVGEDGTHLRIDPSHYDKNGINYLQGFVSKIDPSRKTVALNDGDIIQYDKLLIAAGARPVQPPIPGLDRAGVHTCWTLDDARKIDALAEKGSHVVLMGAGFIGCIVLEALALRGVDLTVVEMGDRMVPRMMDETAGNMLKSWCESKGIRVLTGTKIDKLVDGPEQTGSAKKQGIFSKLFGKKQIDAEVKASAGDTIGVHLDNGETLDAHLVVVSAGVTPNVEFLDGSGIEVDGGIVVDDHLKTSVADIYAAGDIARGRDLSTGGFQVHAIQPTATEHGRVAAQNMAGSDIAYQGSLQMNVLDTVGLISSSFGMWMGVEGGDSVKVLDAGDHRYMRLEFKDDRLVGAQSVGLISNVGIIRGLIQSRTPLGKWKDVLLKNPERLAEAYVACSR